MKIPDSYLQIINPFIEQAKLTLQSGDALKPMAYIFNATTKETRVVMLDNSSQTSKNNSALALKFHGEQLDADFIFLIQEAWTLSVSHASKYKEILDEYGSIGASPYAQDVVSLALETPYGAWMSTPAIQYIRPSKKRRMFGVVDFVFSSDVQGRFSNLLPRKNTGYTLH